MKTIVLLTFTFVLVGAAEASPEPQSAGGATDLTAVVRGVDADANEFEVLTGVGHALRVYRMRVGPSCEIKVAGDLARLAQLKSGQIVHVRYRRTDSGQQAEAIETVPPAAGGGR